MSDPFLLYGATGFSGRLVLEQALTRGLRPILAGRTRRKIETLAGQHGLRFEVVGLHETERLRRLLAEVSVVLNTAGPFAVTARPLVDACLASGTDYLDITGELPVAESLATRDDEARRRGVMLMPAVGFDVVPSDCLALHVARRLPGATMLRIGIDVSSSLSLGSMVSSLSQADDGVPIRRNGRLVSVPPLSTSHYFDFGRGPELALGVSLCDVATAARSTGIPSIEAYMLGSMRLWAALLANRTWGPLLATPIWHALVASQSSWFAPGPSAEARRSGGATIVVEATEPGGRRAAARLVTSEVYSFTAQASIAVLERVLGGAAQAGFRTPAQVFGPDFVLGLGGVTRFDL